MRQESQRSLAEEFPTFRAAWRALRAASRWAFRTFRRPVKVAAKVVLALLVASIAFHTILLLTWKHAVDRKLAEVRRRGEPVTFVEAVPKPVPDRENGALLYRRAFEVLSPAAWPAATSDVLREFVSGAGPPPQPPTPDLVGATRPGPARQPAPKPSDPAQIEQEVRELIRRNEAVFPLVRQAAARPRCVFPVDWRQRPEADVPHRINLTRILRLLQAKAILDTRDGRTEEALDDIVLILRMAPSGENDPDWWPLFSQSLCVRTATKGLRVAAKRAPISAAQARRVYDELGRVSLDPEMARAVGLERLECNWSFDKMRRDLPGFYEVYIYDYAPGYRPPKTSELGPIERLGRKLVTHFWRPMCYREQSDCLDAIDRYARVEGLTYRELVRRVPPHGYLRAPKRTLQAGVYWPNLATLWSMRDQARAEAGLAKAAMALKAHKSHFGSYPASLSELRRRLGWQVPDDPFSGRPFVYRRQGKGFILYSWDHNLKDDGGKTNEEAHTSRDPNKGDVVWKCEK